MSQIVLTNVIVKAVNPKHYTNFRQKSRFVYNFFKKSAVCLHFYFKDTPHLPASMLAKLDRGHVKIAIWFLSDTFDKQKHTIAVHYDATPEAIIQEG